MDSWSGQLTLPKPQHIEKLQIALFTAKGIIWDKCHKIYILSDEESLEYDNDFWEIADPDINTVIEWWQKSCPLRFINLVKNGPETNDDILPIIPQC